MNRLILSVFFAIMFYLTVNAQSNYIQYVDPFIGTGGHGHTYSGATMPFGMVQLSPDTRLTGWDGCSAYHYSDSVIYGFSHTHLSGTGCSDYGDILFMPSVGKPDRKGKNFPSKFKHINEKASPGFYSVILNHGNILVELTVTVRVGFHKYTFPESDSAEIMLDLNHRDKVLESSLKITGNKRIEGMRRSQAWAKDQHIYFAAEFSKPFEEAVISENDTFSDPQKKESTSKNIRAFFRFKTSSGEVIYLKVGISTVSIEGARKNLEAELKDWDFNRVRHEAENSWNKELSEIDVKGNPEQMKIFYTALYHTMVVPNVNMDVDSSYRGRDDKIHKAHGFTYYSVFSLWDTYRAAHPLYTIIEQKRTLDFIMTFLAQYDEGGRLPVWELASNETDCMIGYHSVSVIADAAVKGIKGFDMKKALEAMIKSATWDHYGLPAFMSKGCLNVEDEGESVSKTLEYSYDDWCIAQMAKLLNDEKNYESFIRRAQYYKNIFDPETCFMRPKKNGGWLSPFDPKEVSNNYTEANAWQYTFYVPQDITGLINRMGDPEKFEKKLDELFTTDSKTSGREQADISGMIGQYAHGNEPSHHMAYLYNFAGKPWKTQQRVHQICAEFYKDSVDGLIGNEDCGQMSAWYVLSAMGFYPMTPGNPVYTIGSPLFQEVNIHTENGNTFTIKANNLSNDAFYISSARLNGITNNNSFISHQDIMNGGKIEFDMAKIPGYNFGSKPENIPSTSIKDCLIAEVPVIKAAGRTFRKNITVEIISNNASDIICYTENGKNPLPGDKQVFTSKSPVELKLDKSTTLKAISINKNGEQSMVTTAGFYLINNDKTIKLLSNYSPQYSAGGNDALIDGIYGKVNWQEGDWQGYQGQDFEAVVDMGKIKYHGTFSASFLQDTRSWILFPSKVEFYLSEDGKSYSDSFIVENKIPVNDLKTQIYDFRLQLGRLKPVRYIKVKAFSYGKLPSWHPSAGEDSWIFIDEITVKE